MQTFLKKHRFFAWLLLLAGTAVFLLIGLRRHDRVSVPPADSSAPPAGTAPAPGRPGTETAAPAALSPGAAATVEKILRALAAMEPVMPGEVENKAALELLHWWAEIDPAAAIAYAHAHPGIHGRAELPAELFIAWLDAKGSSVIAWATALPRGELRSRLLPAVISVVAEQRPRDALAMASELSGENRNLALSALFAEWSSADPAGAAAEAQRLPSVAEQNLALRQVVGKWADLDLAAAIDWVKRLPALAPPDSIDIHVGPLEVLLEKWTAQTPLDAMRYLTSLPEGTRRIQMLSTAAGQWAEQSPREALAWAAGLSAETDRNVALRGVLAGVAQTDSATAANLALTLPPGTARQQGIELIIDQWSARAPDSLLNWATAQLADPSRQAALPAIVTAWAGADPDTLGDWLNALPEGDARDTGCAALSRHLAPTRPDLARQWASAISNPGLRERESKDLAGAAGK